MIGTQVNRRGSSSPVHSGELSSWSVGAGLGEKGILETAQAAFVRVRGGPWDSDLVSGRGSGDGWNEWALGTVHKFPHQKSKPPHPGEMLPVTNGDGPWTRVSLCLFEVTLYIRSGQHIGGVGRRVGEATPASRKVVPAPSGEGFPRAGLRAECRRSLLSVNSPVGSEDLSSHLQGQEPQSGLE